MDIVIRKSAVSVKNGLFLLAAVVVVAFIAWSTSSRSVAASALTVLDPAKVNRRVSVVATAEPAHAESRVAGVKGRVVHVGAANGDAVRADDVVMTLANPELEAELDRERISLTLAETDRDIEIARLESQANTLDAQLYDARLEFEEAKVVLDAYAELVKSGAYSRLNYIQADYAARKLEGRIASLQKTQALEATSATAISENLNKKVSIQRSKVQSLALDLAELSVTAGIGGILSNLDLKVGDAVDASQLLFTVNDISSYVFLLDVPDYFHSAIEVGKPVLLQETHGKPMLEGRVTRVNRNTVNGHVSAYATLLLNSDQPYLIGSSWKAYFDSSEASDAYCVGHQDWMLESPRLKLYVIEREASNYAALEDFEVVARRSDGVCLASSKFKAEQISLLTIDPASFDGLERVRLSVERASQ